MCFGLHLIGKVIKKEIIFNSVCLSRQGTDRDGGRERCVEREKKNWCVGGGEGRTDKMGLVQSGCHVVGRWKSSRDSPASCTLQRWTVSSLVRGSIPAETDKVLFSQNVGVTLFLYPHCKINACIRNV